MLAGDHELLEASPKRLHSLVSVSLIRAAKHWKDAAVGYHYWKVITRCNRDDTLCTEKVHGRKDDAIQSCMNHPDCGCAD